MPEPSQHIIQRSRSSCFPGADDLLAYLDLMIVFAAHYECAVHAYALMANHVHMLVTATASSGGSDFAHAVCDRYAVEKKAPTWQEQIRPIHARRYLLACMRYIELNPVRARIVSRPESYRWSSYRANALGYVDPIVTPHPLYYALGRSPEVRRAEYARFVRSGFPRPDSVSP
jgi:putative transposase